MRTIDADSLKPDYIIPSSSTNTLCTRLVSLQQILIAPTIEPKKGKWIKIKENSWVCSECKKENCYAFHYNDDLTGLILQDFFCPNCGAMMERNE